MAGAYVSKPDATITLDIPPEWNPIWPFPGPFPPGYTPSYSIAISAPVSVIAGEAATATVTVYDAVTYKTNAPTELLNLVADLQGYDPFGGDSGFTINGEGFYTVTLEVETLSSDAGKEIEWAASGDPFGVSGVLEQAASTSVIDVGNPIIKIVLTLASTIAAECSHSFEDGDEARATAEISITSSLSTGSVLDSIDTTTGAEQIVSDSGNCVAQYLGGGSGLVTVEEYAAEKSYAIQLSSFAEASISIGSGSASSVASVNIKIYIDDVLQSNTNESTSASVSAIGGQALSDTDDANVTITTHADGTFEIS